MNRFVGVFSIAAAPFTLACSSFGPEPTPLGPEVPLVRLRAEPYSFTFYSGLSTPARWVVRDPAAWHSIWSRIHAGVTPQPPVPVFDFSREVIVVAAMGGRGTGGYTILLEGANEDATGGITIRVLSTSPGPGCLVTQASTAPVDVASMPLRPGPVRFSERNVTTDCK